MYYFDLKCVLFDFVQIKGKKQSQTNDLFKLGKNKIEPWLYTY